VFSIFLSANSLINYGSVIISLVLIYFNNDVVNSFTFVKCNCDRHCTYETDGFVRAIYRSYHATNLYIDNRHHIRFEIRTPCKYTTRALGRQLAYNSEETILILYKEKIELFRWLDTVIYMWATITDFIPLTLYRSMKWYLFKLFYG